MEYNNDYILAYTFFVVKFSCKKNTISIPYHLAPLKQLRPFMKQMFIQVTKHCYHHIQWPLGTVDVMFNAFYDVDLKK